MIPYTLRGSTQHFGALTAGTVLRANLGALPRPLVVEDYHISAWIVLPNTWVPETFLEVQDGQTGALFKPLRTFGDYAVTWDVRTGAANFRWKSMELDTYHQGIVIPQTDRVYGSVITATTANHNMRFEYRLSGYLQTEGLMNSQEASQWL